MEKNHFHIPFVIPKLSMIRKAYKYRIYPNTEQKIFFAKCFGCVRFFYNKSLSDMNDIYKSTGKFKKYYSRII